MRYTNIWGSLILGSSVLVTGCGSESPQVGAGINTDGVTGTLPVPPPDVDVDIPISLPDATAASSQLQGLLTTIAGLFADLEAIEGTGLNGALSELTEALNSAQNSLGTAITESLTGNDSDAAGAISDVINNLIGGDLQAVVSQLSNAFGAEFPLADNPFEGLNGDLNIIDSAFGSSGVISPALLDNAVAVLQPVLDSIGLGIEAAELLSIAEAAQAGLDDIAARPDLVPGVVAHPLTTLSPGLGDLLSALQSGDLQTALGEAQTLATLTALPSILTELGLLSNPLADLIPNLSNATTSDFSDPAERAVVIHLLADVVSTINEVLLGLIPYSVDPAFDPLVGAIIAVTNLLDNVGGNPEGTSIAEALVNNLDGEQTATAIGNSLRDLFSDLFNGVFPVTEITNDMALALTDTSNAIADLAEDGLLGLLTPLTDVLAPIVACLDNVDPVGSAVDSLLGLGDDSCFVNAP